MNFPPFFYVMKFWEALANLLAGIAGLLYIFGWLPAAYALSAAVILQAMLAVIKWFGIEPTLRVLRWTAKAKKLLGR